MSKIYLCGHTGSANRGCEAILHSSSDLLHPLGFADVTAFTFDSQYDKKLGLNNQLELVDYPKRAFLTRAFSAVSQQFFKNGVIGKKSLYTPLFRVIGADDVIFNVGGDTYCYGTPYISYALNELAEKHHIPNVFWGCSVDETVLLDKAMQRDLNRYAYVFVRESLSEDILKQVIRDQTKIVKVCDPAFHLAINTVELPRNFIPGNTLGINISPMVLSDVSNSEEPIYQNIHQLISFVLNQTDMNVCLIPHVYDYEKATEDIAVLSRVYCCYQNDSRVSFVNQDISCTQLKYIISHCRFFIGARTHATIAAYSTGVPTIALSYSVKSRGIAKDLFGTETGYAVNWKDLKYPAQLTELFRDILMDQEFKIRERYQAVLPGYKQTILDGLQRMKQELGM